MINPQSINPLELPSLPLGERESFPPVACIYFAISNGTVQYIGRSKNLNQQWVNHHRADKLQESDTRIAYLCVDDVDLLEPIESALIHYFRPPLNRTVRFGSLSSFVSGTNIKILLADLRMEKNLSLNELARATSLSPQYLGKLEKGEGNPSLDVINRLCKGLQVQPGDLLAYVEEE